MNLFRVLAVFPGAIAALIAAASPASAAPVVWTDWTAEPAASTVTGTLNGIGVTYTGPYSFAQLGTGTNYWTEPAPPGPGYGPPPYTSNTVVDNAPTPAEMVALSQAGTHRVVFASPITDLVMALVSVGTPSVTVTYSFNQDFSLLSTGYGFWNQATSTNGLPPYVLTRTGSGVMTGVEGHGALLFAGPVTSLTWTTNPSENWHGITFGVPVPEPSTYALMLAGLLVMGFVARRRTRG